MATCKGRIKKTVSGSQVTYEKLTCEGDCDDGTPCEWQSSRDHHGSVREWCGCDSTEPTECHIVLYTPGPGVGGGDPEVSCAGGCEDGKECKLEEKLRAKGPHGEVYELSCSCG